MVTRASISVVVKIVKYLEFLTKLNSSIVGNVVCSCLVIIIIIKRFV